MFFPLNSICQLALLILIWYAVGMEQTPAPSFPMTLTQTPALVVHGSIQDAHLALLAASSPVAAFIRTLTTDSSRRGTMQSLTLVADLLVPGYLDPSKGKGRGGNGAARFIRTCSLPFHELRTERLGELRAELIRGKFAPATINKALASLKGVLFQCWKTGLLDGESLARAKSCLCAVRGSHVSKGRHLQKIEISKMFRGIAKSSNPAASRNAALLALLCCGLRRAEVSSVLLSDYEQGTGKLIIKGKGTKERLSFLTNGAKSAVDAWIAVRGTQLTDALLLQINKGGRIVGSGLTSSSIQAALVRISTDVGIVCTCHSLRKTFCGELLNNGVDLSVAQILMGHSSPITTSFYDFRGDLSKQLAMTTLSVPYVACNN